MGGSRAQRDEAVVTNDPADAAGVATVDKSRDDGLCHSPAMAGLIDHQNVRGLSRCSQDITDGQRRQPLQVENGPFGSATRDVLGAWRARRATSSRPKPPSRPPFAPSSPRGTGQSPRGSSPPVRGNRGSARPNRRGAIHDWVPANRQRHRSGRIRCGRDCRFVRARPVHADAAAGPRGRGLLARAGASTGLLRVPWRVPARQVGHCERQPQRLRSVR